MKQKLINSPWFPIFFALYPVLSTYSHNIQELSIDHTFFPIIFSLIFMLSIWGLTNLVIQNRTKSAIFSVILFLPFFSYGHLINIFSNISINIFKINQQFIFQFIEIFPIYYSILWFILGLIILHLLKRNNKSFSKSNILLNLISIVLLISPIFTIIIFQTQRINRQIVHNSVISNNPTDSVKPDIYYLIIDSYAANSTLKEFYGYDNSDFTNFLKDKGFYVAEESSSNYPFTSTSVPSSLYMNYLTDIAQQMGRDSQDYKPLQENFQNNNVAIYLKSKDYKYYRYSFQPLLEDQKGLTDYDFFYRTNSIPISQFSELILLHTTLGAVIKNIDCSNKVSFLCIGTSGRTYTYNKRLAQIDEVGNIAKEQGPKFVFLHSLLTHIPYVMNSDGSLLSESIEQTRNWNENYINQLTFTNILLKQLINTILINSSTPPIIILQSDEGPYPDNLRETGTVAFDWNNATEENIKEKFRILNAYYLPGKTINTLYPSISPVNSFRLVFNAYFGEEFPLLEDKHYGLRNFMYPYDYVDVSDKVQ